MNLVKNSRTAIRIYIKVVIFIIIIIIISKYFKETLSTSVRDHILDCNYMVAWDDIKVLWRESNHWVLEIKESLFIKGDRPSLNKNIYSQELFLF